MKFTINVKFNKSGADNKVVVGPFTSGSSSLDTHRYGSGPISVNVSNNSYLKYAIELHNSSDYTCNSASSSDLNLTYEGTLKGGGVYYSFYPRSGSTYKVSVDVTKRDTIYYCYYHLGKATSGTAPGRQSYSVNTGIPITISDNVGNLARSATSSSSQYTITFNPNGGSTTKTSGTGTRTTTTSYWFNNWSTSSDASNYTHKVGQQVHLSANLDLYPAFGQSKSATNTGVTLPTTSQCTRTGYNLLGFSESSSATSATYSPGAKVTAYSSNTTLYAVWEAKTYQYKVTYDDNGGSDGPGVDYTEKKTSTTIIYTISSTRPWRTGYTFKGWDLDGNGTADYQPDGSIAVARDITLVAVWEAKSYNITFEQKEGETYSANLNTSKAYGTNYQLPSGGYVSKAEVINDTYNIICVPANGDNNTILKYTNNTRYVQNGWTYWNGESGVYTVAELSGYVVIKGAMTFWASWESKTYNTTVTLPSAPTKSGYKFEGWRASDDGILYGAGARYTPTGTGQRQVTAEWSIEYSLSYDANGGSGAPRTQTKSTDESYYQFTISSTKPTWNGYIFLGWSFNQSSTSASFSPGDTVVLYDSQPKRTLYAVWKSTSRYTLTAVVNPTGTGEVVMTNGGSSDRGSRPSLSKMISNSFSLNAVQNNNNYYFSTWDYKAGAAYKITSGSKPSRDITIALEGSTPETTYSSIIYAQFQAWPNVEICCRTSDSQGNPVLNGTYGVGNVKINYSNIIAYASNGIDINSKYEIKGYNVKTAGWGIPRPGTSVHVTALPAAGYEFDRWELNGGVSGTTTVAEFDFTIPTVSCNLCAYFRPKERTVKITNNSAIAYNGNRFYIRKGQYDSSYRAISSSVTIQDNVDSYHFVTPLAPADGYEFVGWYLAGTNTKITHREVNGCAVVEMTPSTTYYNQSVFEARYTTKEYNLRTAVWTVTGGALASGTIDPSFPDGTIIKYGGKLQFTATPGKNSKFIKWVRRTSESDLDLSTSPTLDYTHNYPGDVLLAAVFDLARKFNVYVRTDGQGTVDIIHKHANGTTQSLDQTNKTIECYETDKLILTAKPASGYKFVKWQYSYPDSKHIIESTNATLDYPLLDTSDNLTCIAYFEEIKYTFYFKQQGGTTDTCLPTLTVGTTVYKPRPAKYDFTQASISGKTAVLKSTIVDSQYVFKGWKIINSDGRSTIILDTTKQIDLFAYGESFTITAMYQKAQGTLTIRVSASSALIPSASTVGYPGEGISATDWYNTGDNYKYYLSESECNPGIFGQCTWYVNGRTAQLRGGGPGTSAPNGNKHFEDARYWATEGYYSEPWEVSSTPLVGSVAVFRGINHVGVVEAINDDGTLVISQFNEGPGTDNYLRALAPLDKANPADFTFLNNTANPVICEQQSGSAPITSASSAGGSVWIEYNAQKLIEVTTYQVDDICTIVASPNSGYAFDYWQCPDGNVVSGEENATYSFIVSESNVGTYTAYFRRTTTGPGGEPPEEPYDPETPIEYKYYAYSAVQSYSQVRGQAYWNYKKNKWLVGYGPYLTSKFIELEYIQSNSSDQQWVSIGWRPSPLTIFEFTGNFTNIAEEQLIGCYNCGVRVKDGMMWFECGSKSDPIIFDTNVHTFRINCGTGECYLDNVLYQCTRLDRVSKSKIKLFGQDNDDPLGDKISNPPYSANFKLISAKVWDINPNSSNVLVRDLIPVRRWRRSDTEGPIVGLWDRVFNRFYQSSAYRTDVNGELKRMPFTQGPDILINGEPKVLEKTYR